MCVIFSIIMKYNNYMSSFHRKQEVVVSSKRLIVKPVYHFGVTLKAIFWQNIQHRRNYLLQPAFCQAVAVMLLKVSFVLELCFLKFGWGNLKISTFLNKEARKMF